MAALRRRRTDEENVSEPAEEAQATLDFGSSEETEELDSEKKDYFSEKEITLQFVDKRSSSNVIKLRSRQKASLLVFERKLRFIINPPKVSLVEEMPDRFKHGEYGSEY